MRAREPLPVGEGDLVHYARDSGCLPAVVTSAEDGTRVSLAAGGRTLAEHVPQGAVAEPGTWHHHKH